MNLSTYIAPETSAWVVQSLAHVLWQGVLFAGLAAVAALLLRRRSAQARYGVYCTAMLLTAACLPLNLWLLAPNDTSGSAVVLPVAAVDSTSPIAPASAEAAPGNVDASHAPVPPAPVELNPAQEVSEPLPTDTDWIAAWQWATPWIVIVYIAGIVAMAVRLMMGLYGCQRLRKTAQPIRDPQVQQLLARLGERLRLKVLPVVAYSARVTTPLVVGVVKPAILLPVAILSDLTTEQVESLLMHELAHIRRYDHWVNLLQRVVEAVLFFHPAVWWLSHKISVEREHCCDDLAIRWGSKPCDYAELLVRVSESQYRTVGLSVSSAASLAASRGRPSQLRSRVLRVLGMPHAGPSIGLTRLGVGTLLAIAVTSAVLLAAMPEEESVDLIGDNSSVDDRDADGVTPLWRAVRFSKSESVRALLADGADPNIADLKQGWTPLHCNAFCNSGPKGVDIGQQLLDHGADANAVEPTYGESPLHYAVRVAKSVALSEQLLEAGADVNKKSLKGSTPLQFAVMVGAPELAKLLLDNDADPELRNDAGFRPIDQINAIAPETALEIQEVFRQHGADDQRRPELLKKHQKQSAESPARIVGKIVLEDGSPADVEGWMTYHSRYLSGNGASGNQGRYTDEFAFGVGAGTTWLTYYADGYAPTWTSKLELSPGELRDDIVLVLKPGVSQRVRIVDEDGEPIPNATLVAHPEIYGQSGGPVHKHQTDQRGEYLLEHLAEAKYSFNVEASGYEPMQGELHDLQPDATITLQLSAAAKTTGVVLRESDRTPLAGASIRLVHQSSQAGPDRGFSDSRKYSWWGEQYTVTDEQGQFTLDRLTRGSKYLAVIEAEDGARVIVHGLEAGGSSEILVPPRRDLVVNLTGDLSQLKQGNWKPRISARQRVPFKPWPNENVGELLGGDVVIEPVPGGGKAVLRGLAVDLNSPLEQQEVRVYLPGNEGYERTVAINPRGDTVVEINLGGEASSEQSTADEHTKQLQGSPVTTVRQWMRLAVAGDDDAAAKLVAPGGPNQTDDYREAASRNEITLKEAYATSQGAVVITSALPSKRGRVGVMVFRLHQVDGQWLIKDIDFEDVEEADAQAEGFRGHPGVKAIEVDSTTAVDEEPPTTSSSPAEDIESRVLEILRTPLDFDPAKGSWQAGAHDSAIYFGLAALPQQDEVVDVLLRVVDGELLEGLFQQRLAMKRLAGSAPERLVPLLIEKIDPTSKFSLTDSDDLLLYHQIGVLGDIGPDASDAISVLLKLLDTEDLRLRGAVVDALVKIAPSSTEVMHAIAKRTDDPRTVYELGRYGKLAKPLGPKFVELLDAESERTQIWAASALVTSGYDEARGFDFLIGKVRAGTVESRMLAATALAALGSQAESMIPQLREYENVPNERVAKEVREAIRRIQEDDRILTHAELAAETAAARAAANAPARLKTSDTTPGEFEFTINLVDDTTGKPIQNAAVRFKEDETTWFGDGESSYEDARWSTYSVIQDGKLKRVGELNAAIGLAHFQVFATGYEPVEFKGQALLERGQAVTKTLRMKSLPPVQLVVTTQDGKPAVGATLEALSPYEHRPNNHFSHRSGRFKHLVHVDTKSDRDGIIIFPRPAFGDAAKYRVIHGSGHVDFRIADVSKQATAQGHPLRLIPRATIQGRLLPQVRDDEFLEVHRLKRDRNSTEGAETVELAANGSFELPQRLAGWHTFVHRIRTQFGGNSGTDAVASYGPFYVKGGETLNLSLGDEGRSVIGKLSMASNDNFDFSGMRIWTRYEVDIPFSYPRAPRGLSDTEQQAWWDEYWKSDQARNNTEYYRRHITVPVSPDGSFHFPSLPPGKYELLLNEQYWEEGRPRLKLINPELVVPDQDLGAVLDLQEVAVQPREEPQPHHLHDDHTHHEPQQSQPDDSLVVKLRDKDGNPIPNVKLRVYDGQNVWSGQAAKYKMEQVVSNAEGDAVLDGFFERIPEGAGYWIEIFRQEGANWSPPKRLIGWAAGLTKLHAENPLINTKEIAGGLEITLTLREKCPADIEIVDAATGKRKHFAQLLFKDDRVDNWTVAALQDYVGDPGGEDVGRLGLDFFTTLIPEMSTAQFMATREGYYPVEFQLSEQLSPEKTVHQRVELKPAPSIELTILDANDTPVVGAQLEYLGPNLRGSYSPVKPSDDAGKIALKYPELGALARYRIKHSGGEVEVDAKAWLEGHDDLDSAETIKATVRLP
ncbi:M56 family metallopeptidase [Aeoliella sp.]|uniref:M56 family metallopeptidase n=1 Tax=Aeoliella sp. TaxID=2795800 RepID=UPI003CCBF73A